VHCVSQIFITERKYLKWINSKKGEVDFGSWCQRFQSMVTSLCLWDIMVRTCGKKFCSGNGNYKEKERRWPGSQYPLQGHTLPRPKVLLPPHGAIGWLSCLYHVGLWVDTYPNYSMYLLIVASFYVTCNFIELN
jgi:hypothetical protein